MNLQPGIVNFTQVLFVQQSILPEINKIQENEALGHCILSWKGSIYL